MSSRIQNHWDRVLAAPPPSLEELASDFPGYTFDTTGWGEDQETEVTSFPPYMEARVRVSHTPSHPHIDLTGFTTTHRPLPTLDTAFLTPLDTSHGTPSPFVLNNLNLFPPFPPVDADHQNQLLPYVPKVTRARNVAAASDRYTTDVAANRWRGPVINDEVRKAIGRSGAQTTGDGKEKKRARPKEKENVGGEGDTGTKPKGGFTGEDLIMIARAVIDANPFVAPHGQKGQVWQQVVDALWAQEFRHTTISAASVQHKAEALISYKKDPDGKHKNLSNIIGEGTSASITIGALLERLETNFDAAKDKSEDAKAKLKKKNDEDRKGGDDEDGNTTDRETNTLSTRASAANSSLETINSDDDNATNGKKVSKRRRGMRRSTSSDADGLLGLMKAENARRAAHDTRVAQSLETFVSDSREQKKEFTSLLKELVANDRKANLNDA
ncbi:hypothetical protein B0H10DRAFT_2247163 [Mycena sp. CBHHK59/15]|nr:hypothetical protein B0H10DRAFT_2247163 [Mycena sp. CBHHK59/15]